MEEARPAADRWYHLQAWWSSPVRNALYALGMTALLVYGSYSEAHPAKPSQYFSGGHHPPHTPTAAYLLVAVACLALAWRRRWPAAVLAVSTAAVAVYSLLGYVNGAALLAPLAALYTLASQVSVRRALAAAVGTLAVLLAATDAANPFGGLTGGAVDVMPFTVAVACFAGIAVGSRRAYIASIQARAEDAARRRIDEERLRIARELHDVVAHTMATINVQASAAAHVAADRPQAAVDALGVIKSVSKDGLRELRAILNVLRQTDEPAPQFPAPGLAQVGDLIASAKTAGLPVTLTVTGSPAPLPDETDLAAYRIIQESLTNAIRHAGPASATVSLCFAGTELTIEVADNGLGSPVAADSSGGGHGLPGMRERAASVGGVLDAGPAAGGGFRVSARLPLSQPPGGQPPGGGHGQLTPVERRATEGSKS